MNAAVTAIFFKKSKLNKNWSDKIKQLRTPILIKQKHSIKLEIFVFWVHVFWFRYFIFPNFDGVFAKIAQEIYYIILTPYCAIFAAMLFWNSPGHLLQKTNYCKVASRSTCYYFFFAPYFSNRIFLPPVIKIVMWSLVRQWLGGSLQSVVYFSQCFSSVSALLQSVLYFSQCFTSVSALLQSVLYFSQCFTSVSALLQSVIWCFTSVIGLLQSVQGLH
jgi:hypothetical protein